MSTHIIACLLLYRHRQVSVAVLSITFSPAAVLLLTTSCFPLFFTCSVLRISTPLPLFPSHFFNLNPPHPTLSRYPPRHATSLLH